MARKKDSGFNIESELNFTTQETQEKEITQEKELEKLRGLRAILGGSEKILQSVPMETAKKIGRPVERPNTYRFSLYLDGDLEGYIKYKAWKNKQSITQYLNTLVRDDMQAYVKDGGDESEWTNK